MQNTQSIAIPEIIRNDSLLYEGDLKVYFKAIFYKSQNLNHPYHNFRHTLHMLWLCYQACEFYKDELSPRQMRNLLVRPCFMTSIIRAWLVMMT